MFLLLSGNSSSSLWPMWHTHAYVAPFCVPLVWAVATALLRPPDDNYFKFALFQAFIILQARFLSARE